MRETDEPGHDRTAAAPSPFAADEEAWAQPPLFAASAEEPAPRRSGLRLWLAAAAALVVGIVIGFGAGYRAGETASPAAGIVPAGQQPAASPELAPPTQTFSESAIAEPTQVESEPIVPAPPAVSEPATAPPPRPAPPPRDAAPRAVDRPTPSPRPEPSPAATAPGALQVVSRPAGAQIILDGKLVGLTPLLIADVSPGAHTVRLELPGFNRWATTVQVTAGSQLRVAASLEQ